MAGPAVATVPCAIPKPCAFIKVLSGRPKIGAPTSNKIVIRQWIFTLERPGCDVCELTGPDRPKRETCRSVGSINFLGHIRFETGVDRGFTGAQGRASAQFCEI